MAKKKCSIGKIIGAILIFVLIMWTFKYFYDKYSKEGFDADSNFVMYYADWCGHCKTTKPEFKKLMDAYNGKKINGKSVKIEMVNSDVEPERVKAAGVEGYPTIKLDGKMYSGGRTFDAFEAYLHDNI